jgi:hypothetical protein
MSRHAVLHSPRGRRLGARAGLLAAVAALAIIVAGSAVAATVSTRVTPGAGGIHQVFRLSLRRPATTGATGVFITYDTVSVGGPRRRGCVSDATLTMPDGRAGSTGTVALNPRRMGGRWCVGTFRGAVVEHQMTRCGTPQRFERPAIVCPMLVVAPRTIARFHFVVR